MYILIMILLGVVQGLCEFLPISSSGHLVLLSKLFHIENSLFLTVLLHVATLLSVCVVLRKEIKYCVCNPFSKESVNLVLSCIPTCVIVLLLLPVVKQSFSGDFLPFSFLICGVILFCCEIFLKKKARIKKFSSTDISAKKALFMGVCQGLAIFPGISRSGLSIAGGLLCGGDKEKVASFSFLMSIPIIVLSLFTELYDFVASGQSISNDILGYIVSFVFAFLTGIFAIKFMIKATNKINFKWFGLYLIVLSFVCFYVL